MIFRMRAGGVCRAKPEARGRDIFSFVGKGVEMCVRRCGFWGKGGGDCGDKVCVCCTVDMGLGYVVGDFGGMIVDCYFGSALLDKACEGPYCRSKVL